MKTFFTHKHNKPTIWLSVIAVCILVLNAYLLLGGGQDQWAPLVDYPTQRIVNGEKKIDGIWVIPFDEYVEIKGIKCAVSDAPVSITGSLTWFSAKPLVTSIGAGGGANQRLSCDAPKQDIEYTFKNDPPLSLLERVLEVKKRTDEYPVWILTGTETPYRDGEEGVSATWRTEPFILVPKEEYNKIGVVAGK